MLMDGKEGYTVARADWAKLKAKYVKGTMTYRQLATDTGVSLTLINQHGSKEHWQEARSEYRRKTAAKATQKASDAAAARLARVGETAGILIDRTLAAIGDPDQLNRYIVQRQQEYAEPVEDPQGRFLSRDSWTEEQIYSKLDTKALRDMTAALKDLTGVIRSVYGIPTQAEAEAQRIAAERLEMDKAKAATDAGSSDMVIELPPEMEEWSK